MDSGVVRLDGPAEEIMRHPEIATLYLGGTASKPAAAG
jgi:hypothetical protein